MHRKTEDELGEILFSGKTRPKMTKHKVILGRNEVNNRSRTCIKSRRYNMIGILVVCKRQRTVVFFFDYILRFSYSSLLL